MIFSKVKKLSPGCAFIGVIRYTSIHRQRSVWYQILFLLIFIISYHVYIAQYMQLCSISSAERAPLVSAALPMKTAEAAAIARPARTRCQRFASGEKTEFCGACVSTVGAGRKRADFYEYELLDNSTLSTCIKYTWLQYKKWQIEAPGTTFSIFGDKLWMEGHGNS